MKFAAMNTRDRRALMLGAVVAIPGLAIPLVVKPYVNAVSSVREQTDDERDRLAREQRSIADLRTLPTERKQASDKLGQEVNRLFQAADPLVASGELAQYVATTAQSDGLRLQQSETRPTRVLGAGVEALQVEVRAQGDLDGILHFLQHLETGDKLIRVGTVSIDGGQQPLQIPGNRFGNFTQLTNLANLANLANGGGIGVGGGFPGGGRVFSLGGGNATPLSGGGMSFGGGLSSGGGLSIGGGGVTVGSWQPSVSVQVQGGGDANAPPMQVLGDTSGATGQFLRRFLGGRGFGGRRRRRFAAQNQEQQNAPADVQTVSQPQLSLQGQAEVLSLTATIYAYRLTSAPWLSTNTQGKGGTSPFSPPAYDFESIDEVLNHDLFNANRTRPSMSFRDAIAAANRPPVRQVQRQQPNLRLIGTVVGDGPGGFAMCQGGDSMPPQAVRVGESCAGYTLTSLSRGSAVFSSPDGNQIQLQAPQPGTSQ